MKTGAENERRGEEHSRVAEEENGHDRAVGGRPSNSKKTDTRRRGHGQARAKKWSEQTSARSRGEGENEEASGERWRTRRPENGPGRREAAKWPWLDSQVAVGSMRT